MKITEKLLEDVNARLNKFIICGIREDDCYGWSGALCNRGYARISLAARSTGANRAAWMVHKGRIPKGSVVRLVCENRLCTNPAHLYLSKNKRPKGSPPTGKEGRLNRTRFSVDIAKNLVEGIRENAKKRNITMTKYITALVTTALAIERSYEDRDE